MGPKRLDSPFQEGPLTVLVPKSLVLLFLPLLGVASAGDWGVTSVRLLPIIDIRLEPQEPIIPGATKCDSAAMSLPQACRRPMYFTPWRSLHRPARRPYEHVSQSHAVAFAPPRCATREPSWWSVCHVQVFRPSGSTRIRQVPTACSAAADGPSREVGKDRRTRFSARGFQSARGSTRARRSKGPLQCEAVRTRKADYVLLICFCRAVPGFHRLARHTSGDRWDAMGVSASC